MGKKKKEKKGNEKTAKKTEKNISKRVKKELEKKGEDDVEKMIADFVEKDLRSCRVVEEKSLPPSLRSNMTLVAHPDKEELIFYGGEYCTGKQTLIYGDLFFYAIHKREWTMAVTTVGHSGGQMWVFGGEFCTPSQSQFHHYRDLWLLHLKDKKWEEVGHIVGKSGPSARSGHRMVTFKGYLILFGGFRDNHRDIQYFNDLWAFDLRCYSWTELVTIGGGPSPRSGCVLLAGISRLLLYGGYSLEKDRRDFSRGVTQTDMFALVPGGKTVDNRPVSWRWVSLKQKGFQPPARNSMSAVITVSNRGVIFGGVHDEEEDDELLEGTFFNDLYSVDVEKACWSEVHLRHIVGKSGPSARSGHRMVTFKGYLILFGGFRDNHRDIQYFNDLWAFDLRCYSWTELVTIGGGPSPRSGCVLLAGISRLLLYGGYSLEKDRRDFSRGVTQTDMFALVPGGKTVDNRPVSWRWVSLKQKGFQPPARNSMSAVITVSNRGVIFGGVHDEEEDDELLEGTFFNDLYSVDVEKACWSETWQDSDSDSDKDDDGKVGRQRKTVDGAGVVDDGAHFNVSCDRDDGRSEDDDDEDDDDEDDDDDDFIFEDAPCREDEESSSDYFKRTERYWMQQAETMMTGKGSLFSDRTLLRLARDMCQGALDQH